jgi:hypothetical protein
MVVREEGAETDTRVQMRGSRFTHFLSLSVFQVVVALAHFSKQIDSIDEQHTPRVQTTE